MAQEKIALEKIITESHTKMVALQTKYDGLIQQLSDKQTRVEELHKQNKQTQTNLEHYQAAQLLQRQQDQQRAEQQERELTQSLQQVKMENDTLRQQKIILQQSHDQLQSAQNNLQVQLEKMTLLNERNTDNLMEVNTILTKKTACEQHWKDQHDSIYDKLEKQTKITSELQIHNAILSQQLIAMKSELNDVAEQKKILAHDKWILGQEKAQLFGQVKQLQATL